MGTIITKFENITNEDMFIVLDPPCIEYVIKPSKLLLLKIVRSTENKLQDLGIVIRYDINQTINIDVSVNFKVIVIIDGTEEIVWEGL